MAKFADNMKSLFTGEETDAVKSAREQQDRQVADAKAQQTAAINHQQQQLQVEGALRDQQAGATARLPRGRRLLLAATGERGVQSKLG